MVQPIKTDLYKTIHQLMPIVCVDVVVMVEDQVLLIKRAREPAKGQQWFPGGRLFRGELIKDAAQRIVKAETNLNIIKQQYLGFDETIFEEDPFDHGFGTHTVNHVFAAKVRSMELVAFALDDHHVSHELVKIDSICDKKDLDPYVKKFIFLAEAALRRQ